MPRPILDESRIHPTACDQVASLGGHADFVTEVERAVREHPVVVVGMAVNPFPKRARRMLDAAGIAHHDIDHGSYLSGWRRRNALKMWSGWPTFPMVFVRGTLVGGADDLRRLLESGELKRMLA